MINNEENAKKHEESENYWFFPFLDESVQKSKNRRKSTEKPDFTQNEQTTEKGGNCE